MFRVPTTFVLCKKVKAFITSTLKIRLIASKQASNYHTAI
jgi:hypothetical protein